MNKRKIKKSLKRELKAVYERGLFDELIKHSNRYSLLLDPSHISKEHMPFYMVYECGVPMYYALSFRDYLGDYDESVIYFEKYKHYKNLPKLQKNRRRHSFYNTNIIYV